MNKTTLDIISGLATTSICGAGLNLSATASRPIFSWDRFSGR